MKSNHEFIFWIFIANNLPKVFSLKNLKEDLEGI